MVKSWEKIEKIKQSLILKTISDCLGIQPEGEVIVTVIALVDGESIWSEAEVEEKNKTIEWLDELSKTCDIKLIHLTNCYGLNKTWSL